jgi:hypothetical protein
MWFDSERDLTYGSAVGSQIDIQCVYSDLTTADG